MIDNLDFAYDLLPDALRSDQYRYAIIWTDRESGFSCVDLAYDVCYTTLVRTHEIASKRIAKKIHDRRRIK